MHKTRQESQRKTECAKLNAPSTDSRNALITASCSFNSAAIVCFALSVCLPVCYSEASLVRDLLRYAAAQNTRRAPLCHIALLHSQILRNCLQAPINCRCNVRCKQRHCKIDSLGAHSDFRDAKVSRKTNNNASNERASKCEMK